MHNNYSCASTDVYFTDTENRYRRISEDAGTIFISITSRATEEKEAFIIIIITLIMLITIIIIMILMVSVKVVLNACMFVV